MASVVLKCGVSTQVALSLELWERPNTGNEAFDTSGKTQTLTGNVPGFPPPVDRSAFPSLESDKKVSSFQGTWIFGRRQELQNTLEIVQSRLPSHFNKKKKKSTFTSQAVSACSERWRVSRRSFTI